MVNKKHAALVKELERIEEELCALRKKYSAEIDQLDGQPLECVIGALRDMVEDVELQDEDEE